MTPTQRSLKHLRGEGYTVGIVEHWNPFAHIRQDLFGFVDLVALDPKFMQVIFVQTTSGSNVSARVQKIEVNPHYATAKAAGVRVEVHGWSKRGERGKRKTWQLRIVEM